MGAEPLPSIVQAYQDNKGQLHNTVESAMKANYRYEYNRTFSGVSNQLQRWGAYNPERVASYMVEAWPAFRDMMEAYYNADQKLKGR